ncbi:MAG: SPOR domain-containing protein [Treponema sp.]|jgi:hypothetical protein|nr:SPOR domain-containing protein [Treponema sp.]
MKKLIVVILAASLFFVSASVWEGSAAVGGDLPEKGYYAKTNSFPRNTVIDITNLENNKSIRLIIAGSLDSPGLLAVISKEAAETIGMQQDSITRIRLTQPTDPVAYLRFTEGMAAGMPVYDSGAVITEENYKLSEPVQDRAPANGNRGASAYVLEPEWGGTGARGVVDLGEYTPQEPHTAYIPPNRTQENTFEEAVRNTDENVAQNNGGNTHDDLVWNYSDNEYSNEYRQPDQREEYHAVALPPSSDNADVNGGYASEPSYEYYEAPIVQHSNDSTPIHDVSAQDQIAQTSTDNAPISDGTTEYTMVTSQERPPAQRVYEIDPNSIIPGIEPREARDIDPDSIIPGIGARSQEARDIDPESIIPGIGSARPQEQLQQAPVVTSPFSARMITQLERNSYYVQLAAFNHEELVESALNDIDDNFLPVVCIETSGRESMYRVLLGPLNQGESGALLQRFKSIGFKDAFVRQGR